MSFALGISDFSIGEGIYRPQQLLRVAQRLGYRDLVLWDRGLQGYPKLREELEWSLETERPAVLHGTGGHGTSGEPEPVGEGLRIHLGCRFRWRGHEYGALPF